MDRRTFLKTAGAGSAAIALTGIASTVLLGGWGGGNYNFNRKDLIEFGPQIGLETVAEGLQMPVDMVFQSGHNRRYIADRFGQIRVHESSGLRQEPLLDLSSMVLTGGEQGLLGLALHPNFNSNRRLFVRYSAPSRSGTPDDFSHTFVLSEFEITSDYQRAIPTSERSILEIPEPHEWHNAGSIVFGPDGYLYVGVGDGGYNFDIGPRGKADDWYEWNLGGNGQDVTENLHGSVLRIDVDKGGPKSYGIPDDNPLVGKEGLNEHFAWGFRNPWKMSFSEGELFVADVGQSEFEEVNIVEKGGNYGWNVREGKRCLNLRSKRVLPYLPFPWCPKQTPDGNPLIDPIIVYPHNVRTLEGVIELGTGVIGGYKYQGDTIPEFNGSYVFGDLFSETYSSGRLFIANEPVDSNTLWSIEELRVAGSISGRTNGLIIGFGQDNQGEIYVLHVASEGGRVDKLVPA